MARILLSCEVIPEEIRRTLLAVYIFPWLSSTRLGEVDTHYYSTLEKMQIYSFHQKYICLRVNTRTVLLLLRRILTLLCSTSRTPAKGAKLPRREPWLFQGRSLAACVPSFLLFLLRGGNILMMMKDLV